MNKKQSGMSVEKVALSGLLLAIMLILGYIESLIPPIVPIPGVKLGLSNGVLLFSLYLLNIPMTLVLMALKVLLSALMFGNINSLMFALSGGVLSLLVMIPLSRLKDVSIIVVSMAGAVFHNVGQVLAAFALMPEVAPRTLLSYLAVLMAVGLATGALTGVLAREVLKRMKRFSLYTVSRYYRAPELILGKNDYDEKIDIFALGCIMAELFTLIPLFPGKSEGLQIFEHINYSHISGVLFICQTMSSGTCRG